VAEAQVQHDAVAAAGAQTRSRRQDFQRTFFSNRLALFGAAVMSVFIVMAVFAPFIAPYDPLQQELTEKFAPPSRAHLLGQDELGRDILSRVIYGARISLTAGLAAVPLTQAQAGAAPPAEPSIVDRMRAQGAHLQNAFVTTSLCSPSRASILTGRYAHRHGVVDNTSPIPRGTVFFPEHLKRAGYRTGYIGKWHMGEDAESDQPRAGFDHWISFRGQGVYVDPVLNVNGQRRQLRGYTTDILTDSALAWLRRQRRVAESRARRHARPRGPR
jgi:hypothetical protein